MTLMIIIKMMIIRRGGNVGPEEEAIRSQQGQWPHPQVIIIIITTVMTIIWMIIVIIKTVMTILWMIIDKTIITEIINIVSLFKP